MDDPNIMRICVFDIPTWTKVGYKDNGLFLLDGLLKEIFNIFDKNFNATLQMPLKHEYGKRLPNESWTGCIGQLIRKEADVMLLPFFPSIHVPVDTTVPFHFTYMTILSGGEETISGGDSGYLINAFQPRVWQFSILSIIVLALCSGVSEWLLKGGKSIIRSFFRYLYIFSGLAFTEATLIEMKYISVLESITVFLFGVTIIRMSFLSNMQATFSSITKETIEDIEGIFKKPDVVPIIMASGSAQRFFSNSGSKIIKQLWRLILHHKSNIPLNKLLSLDTVKMAATGKTVILFDWIPLAPLIRQACDFGRPAQFYFSKQPVKWHFLTLGIRKNLPKITLDLINKRFGMFSDTYQLEHQLKALWRQAELCLWKPGNNVAVPMKLGHLTLGFQLLMAGLLFSMIVLGFEIVSHILRSSKKLKNRSKKRRTSNYIRFKQ